MNKDIELLAPAGNIDCLKQAVMNGADAVYLGMNKFNAREFAGNFSKEELKQAINYAHENGVKVYVTFNTLIKDKEMQDWFNEINFAYSCGCDAIIIQDYWLLPKINEIFPDLEIHLSTQSFLINQNSIEFVKKLGKFKRVVLPRELSLEEIKQIKTDIELEIFCHGAICMCYSGQCLLSSLIGGRSGNRGKCAQPCRKLYNEKYLLSTYDMMLIEHIPEIINAGIKSIKIEGRMRSPLYTAIVVRNYKKAIEAYKKNRKYVLDEETKAELELAFNRGFTDDYFKGKNNVIANQIPSNRGIYLGKYKESIELLHDIKLGDGYFMSNEQGGRINKIILQGKSVEQANKRQIVNLGFELKKEEDMFMNSCVNIEEKYLSNNSEDYKRKKISMTRENIIVPEIKITKKKAKQQEILTSFNNEYSYNNDKIIFKINSKTLIKDIENIREQKNKKNLQVYIKTRDIVTDNDILKDMKIIEKICPDGVVVSNIGYLNQIKKQDFAVGKKYDIILDYNMNIFNSVSFEQINSLGYNAIISLELNIDEMTQIKNKNFFVMVHGPIIVARTKANLDDEIITDDKAYSFKVKEGKIYNSKELGLFENVKKLKDNGITHYFIEGIDPEIYKIILDNQNFKENKLYKEFLKINNSENNYTTGHLKRGV